MEMSVYCHHLVLQETLNFFSLDLVQTDTNPCTLMDWIGSYDNSFIPMKMNSKKKQKKNTLEKPT